MTAPNLKSNVSEMRSGLGPTARKWLEDRGLDSELCDRLGVRSRQGRDGGEIVFDYEREGEIVYWKARAIPGKAFHAMPGGELCFWRYDAITDKGLADQPLVITEGELDCVAAIQAGFWRSVSVPGGAPANATPEQEAKDGARYKFVEAARTALDPVKEIIIAADADNPGAALLTDLSRLLNQARCKFVTYPDGCKDLNDVLLKHGEEGVQKCLGGAKWVKVPGVYRMSDLPPLPELNVWRPKLLPQIDARLPICPGHLSIWTGIAGHGKSALLNACMWSIADQYGYRIAHAPLESTPQREYRDDFLAHRQDLTRRQALDWLEEHIVFLNADGYANPESDEWIDATLDWFLDAARTAVVRFGCRIVILDPWSQIDHDRGSNEREDEYIRRILKALKQFARTFDVHVAIVAHPTKPQRDRDGLYQMPLGYEISGAAHWFNFADLGVTVHRDPAPDKDGNPDPSSPRVQIMVWKVKFHRSMGKPGRVYANFRPASGTYDHADIADYKP